MTEEVKRFEQWWDAEEDIPNNGPYTPDTPIQFAWAGWQAALAEQPAQQEPVAFEEWLAKQHGDPEEIGFLQALRIAYIAGQDSITSPPAQQELVAWASDVLFDNDTEIIPANDKGKLGTGNLTVALYIKGETT